MNTKYEATPEVIATVRTIGEDKDYSIGDVVAGVSIQSENGKAVAQIDLRNLDLRQSKDADHLIIEIELSEIIAAISFATLNADRE